jgi:hypothetical protein
VVYTLHRGKQQIYRLRYHPQPSQASQQHSDDILQKGKDFTTGILWSLLDLFTKSMPQGTENFTSLPIVRWDVHQQKWITQHPPDLQLSGNVY